MHFLTRLTEILNFLNCLQWKSELVFIVFLWWKSQTLIAWGKSDVTHGDWNPFTWNFLMMACLFASLEKRASGASTAESMSIIPSIILQILKKRVPIVSSEGSIFQNFWFSNLNARLYDTQLSVIWWLLLTKTKSIDDQE